MISRNASARQALKDFSWTWKRFTDLTLTELYEIIQVRETVFVVEQKLSYVDCDDYDRSAWHLLGRKDGKLVAYLRAFPPGVKYPEASFGRVLTMLNVRRSGIGRELTRTGLHFIEKEFGTVEVRISAQAYLERFYEDFGFSRVSEVYLEEGIPHLRMLRPKSSPHT